MTAAIIAQYLDADDATQLRRCVACWVAAARYNRVCAAVRHAQRYIGRNVDDDNANPKHLCADSAIKPDTYA